VVPASAVPAKVGVVTLVISSLLDVPLSLAAVMSGVEGMAGAVVSMVMLSALDATLVLPAASVALAVMLCVPSLRALTVMPGELYAAAVPLPTCVAPSKRVTVLPASAAPVKAGVVVLVMLSVLDEPVSVAAVMSGAVGAAGAVVSIVAERPVDAALTFPATSVALAVMVCDPEERALTVMPGDA